MKYQATFRMDGLRIEIEAQSEEEAFDKAVDTLSNMTEDDVICTLTDNRKLKLSECFDDPKIVEYQKGKGIRTHRPTWSEYLKRLKRHWKR